MHGAFRSFPDPFLIIEQDSYRVIAANAKARDQAPAAAVTCHEMLWGLQARCQGQQCPVDYVMATWIPMRAERAVTRDDGSTRVFEVQAFPIREVIGDVRFIALITADITDRKKEEHSAVSGEHFRAVGELAGAAAHRFNNLLQVVVAGAQMALADLEAGDTALVRDALEDILTSIGKGQNAVMGLLDVARAGSDAASPEAVLCDLSVAVGQAISVLSPSWRDEGQAGVPRTRLNEALSSGCVVRATKRELLELATGLVRHAMGAAPEGSVVRVATATLDGAVVLTVSHPGEPDDNQPLRGSSMPMEGGQWMPTELAAVHLIAERLGGSLTVGSADIEGSSYVVRLPSTGSHLSEDGTFSEVEPLSLLLIDDNPEVLAALEDGLRRADQMVVTAPSGRAGLQILRSRQVDAVVCDFLMPEMDGLDVGREIAEIFRDRGGTKPPFVLLTGWLSERERSRIEAAEVDRILQKPLEPARLLGVIRQLIESRQ